MEGAYGCVTRDSGRISKAFQKADDLKEEYDVHQKLHLQDIKNYTHFYITNPEKHRLNQPVMCKGASVLDVLQYEDGGEPLSAFAKNMDSKAVFLGMANIFQGVKRMNRKKRYHLDIKPANIVIDPAGVFRLIDFGFSKNLEHVQALPEVQNPHFNESYEYWPIEMMLLERLNSLKDKVDFDQVYPYIRGYTAVLKDDLPVLRMNKIQLETQDITGRLGYTDIYDKCDVWGLGITLCYLYEIFKTTALLPLIQKLLTFNPLQRPSATEACKAYLNFLYQNYPETQVMTPLR